MFILRRIFLGLTLLILGFFLWGLAADIGFVHLVDQPNRVKQILSSSGIYSSVVPSVLDQAKTIQINGNQVSTSDPIVRSAATQAFPTSLVQKDTEQVIDSISTWLNTNSAQPDFRIDLSAPKAAFAQNLASGIQVKLSSLPACTTAPSPNFDPFTATIKRLIKLLIRSP